MTTAAAAFTVVRRGSRGVRAGRPSYPPEAIDWLLPSSASDVLDLGAGTGKLTTRLVERGLDVVAVDPIPEMLELLSNSLPDTPALLGTAEEIPLPDDSVDAVLVAQAWHWFDTERAVRRWRGCCGPAAGWAWCGTPATSGWAGSRIWAASSATRTPSSATRRRCPRPFTDVERHQVEWTSYLTPQALIDLVASRSYCITSPEKVRTRTLDRVRDLSPPIPRWRIPTAWRCHM